MKNKITNTSCTIPVKKSGLGQDYQLSIVLLYSNPMQQKYINKPITANKKVMSVLEYQIHILNHMYKNCEIIVISHENMTRPKNCRFVENQIPNETGEVEQIRIGLKNINNDNVLICTGNSFFIKENISNIVQNKSSILYTDSEQYPIGINIDNDYVEYISYAIPTNRWCEIAFFNGPELEKLNNFVNKKEKKKLFLFEAINDIIDDGGKFKSVQDIVNSTVYRI